MDTSLHQIKISIYRVVLYFGVSVPIMIWLFNLYAREKNLLNLIFHPVMSLYCLLSIALFKKLGIRYLRYFELTVFAVVFIYMVLLLSQMAYRGLATGVLEIQKFLMWFPMIYIISFMMFTFKTALRFSILFFFCILIIGTLFLTISTTDTWNIDNLHLLFEMLAASVMYPIVLYVIVLLKNKVQESELRADIMSELANTDALTGISNRRKISETIKQFIDHEIQLSIILADVDGFKKINDTFGHDDGDILLKDIASLLYKNIRRNDSVGRWGGDEFIIVCPYMTDPISVHTRMERINDNDVLKSTGCSLSYGFSSYEKGDTLETLLMRADKILYNHKSLKKRDKNLKTNI